MEVKTFDTPDEVRPFKGHGHGDVVEVDGHVVLRGTFEPGWRWSQDVKPIAGTDLCETAHLVYIIQGTMTVELSDGTQTEFGPGDVGSIEPGHDAWVTSGESCIAIDFGAVSHYAVRGE